MNSFQAIAVSSNTSLAVVAPGIAEALFATALGLLAAIPAVVAYNKLSRDLDRYAGSAGTALPASFRQFYRARWTPKRKRVATDMASVLERRSSGGRFGRGRSRPMSEINVTPFVDVMLVLLIIFMVTAPLLTVGVEVNLPKTEAGAVAGDDEPLAISITAAGEIFSARHIGAARNLGAATARHYRREPGFTDFCARRCGYQLWPRHGSHGHDQPGLAIAASR